MSEYKKVIDERLHGGEASVKIEGDAVKIFSSAGYQTIPLADFPKDLLRKIQGENEDGKV